VLGDRVVHNDTYICIELSGVEVTVKGPVENGQRQGRRAAYGRLCRLAGQSLSDFRDAFRSTGFSKPYWTGVAYIQSSESPQSLLPYHRPLRPRNFSCSRDRHGDQHRGLRTEGYCGLRAIPSRPAMARRSEDCYQLGASKPMFGSGPRLTGW
jgi:hypothetical protein